MLRFLFLFSVALGLLPAQHDHDMQHMDHEHMQHGQHAGMQHEHSGANAAGDYLMMQASGTSMNPQAWMMPMLMLHPGSWDLMIMGTQFLVDTQQSGPRGHDKLYGADWFMVSAEHAAGRGALMLQLMGSLDPITITQRRYPELFQTGETAYGKPLVDAQHPHDLIMGLGVHYAYPLGENTTFQAYFAPVGDPALGPVAFPHRASAEEIPQASLSHHWQDSTHIANEVATVALMHKKLRIEASGFHGREPNENRWNIDYGAIDSWSARLSVFPAKNWMAQISAGRLNHPEATEAGDVVRTTASIQYTKPLGRAAWSSSFIWGRNHKTIERRDSDSFLAETVVPFHAKNFLTGRVEVVDKDELFAGGPHGDVIPAARVFPLPESFRIAAYTLGYTRDVAFLTHLQAGIGANFTAYGIPGLLTASYGAHPFGASTYVRFRLR